MIPAMWRSFIVACASGQIDDATQQRAANKLAEEAKRKAREKVKARPASLQRARDRRVQKKIDADIHYAIARVDAFSRASVGVPGTTCEVYERAVRCTSNGVDPDHVLGGASRKECERLGAEGLQVMCRHHHDIKTVNSPTGRYWLEQAKAHALRIGARRLLPLVERALAKYDAKHGGNTR